MGSESNALYWLRNLCHPFNALISEVEEMEPIRYLHELTTAGDSLMQFCSELVEDVLLMSSCGSAEETAHVFPKQDDRTDSPAYKKSNGVNVDNEGMSNAEISFSPLLTYESVGEIPDNFTANKIHMVYSYETPFTANSDFPACKMLDSTAVDHEAISNAAKYSSPFLSTESVVEMFTDSSSDEFPSLETLHSSKTPVRNYGQTDDEDEYDVHSNSSISSQFLVVHSSERSDRSSDLADNGSFTEFNLTGDETISFSSASTEAYHSSENTSAEEVSDCDVIKEDTEATLQKLGESIILVEADESHSDSDQEETLQPTNKKRPSKGIHAESDGAIDQAVTLEEDFSDSEWEIV